MAVSTITVDGKVLLPTGAGAPGGEIEITLAPAGGTDDGGTEHLIGGQFTTPIGTDGTVAFSIVPNEDITPAGSVYKAKIILPDGREFNKTWDIANTPSTQNIGDL